MKILHLVPTYWPAVRYGGPIQNVHNLNKELVRQGVSVTVLTTNVDGPADLDVPLGKPVLIDGVEVFYFPSKRLRRWFYSPDLFRFIEKNVQEFDLIHITSVFLYFSFLGAAIARRRNKPYVISPRGSLMRQTFASKFWKKILYFNLIEKRNLAEAATVHLTSEAENADYLAAGFPAKKIFIIGNGLDFKEIDDDCRIAADSFPADYFRKKLQLDLNQKVVICLGRIDWTKGFDDLIPAFSLVVRELPDAILLVVGNDERGYKKTVLGLVKKNNLQKNVIFVGSLHGPEKIAALKFSDVLVQASYSESFGTSVAEAMLVGLPVVATKGVAIAPTVEKTGSGLIINKDSEKIAGALLDVLRNNGKAATMARNGQIAARQAFSYGRIAADFLALYNAVIDDFQNKKRKER